MILQWDKAYKDCVLTSQQIRDAIGSKLRSCHSSVKKQEKKKNKNKNNNNPQSSSSNNADNEESTSS